MRTQAHTHADTCMYTALPHLLLLNIACVRVCVCVCVCSLAAPPSSAAAAGGVRGVWQDIFRWEVEGGGEGGTQGSQYDFHHLDTNMRFRVSERGDTHVCVCVYMSP